jgi:hypothetical protein
MYRFPSMSYKYGPSARSMNKGVPPTAPNARAGELTPPGINADARWNAATLLGPAAGRAAEEFAGEFMVVGGGEAK